jgi:hypothetical protein
MSVQEFSRSVGLVVALMALLAVVEVALPLHRSAPSVRGRKPANLALAALVFGARSAGGGHRHLPDDLGDQRALRARQHPRVETPRARPGTRSHASHEASFVDSRWRSHDLRA